MSTDLQRLFTSMDGLSVDQKMDNLFPKLFQPSFHCFSEFPTCFQFWMNRREANRHVSVTGPQHGPQLTIRHLSSYPGFDIHCELYRRLVGFLTILRTLDLE